MDLRFERKYLVPNNQLNEFRNRMQPFLLPDVMAKSEKGAFPEYTVRSIYFDSPVFNSYYEKVEGYKMRKKLRIRGYNNYEPGCKVFLEIKRKLENNITKNRALVPFDSLQDLLETSDIEKYVPKEYNSPAAIEDAERFFYNLKRYSQKPTNLVVYEREPYHGKFDPGVRLTLDKNVRASIQPKINDLYNEEGLVYLWEKFFILEIKYFTPVMPRWARSLVEEFKLKHAALSKYTTGMDGQQFVFH
ncbi:MAG: polyphosphate polymerase domain-containing protein [Bacteroidota bacterium]|nr:polyphosphate polymerase domain-containing protein [Bacteroidota bacterium]